MKTFRTILSIKEQQSYQLGANAVLVHKWSSRGMGNSKLINNMGDVVGKADGCGYDRWGACLGEFIAMNFSKELVALARKTVKGKARKNTGFAPCPAFYGMQYNKKKELVSLDGGCGSSCMVSILNALGFNLRYAGENDNGNNGTVHYILEPLNKGTVRAYGV